MMGPAQRLIGDVNSNPIIKLLPGIEGASPTDVTMGIGAELATAIARLGLDAELVRAMGGDIRVHEEVASILGDAFRRLGKVSVSLGNPPTSALDLVSFFDRSKTESEEPGKVTLNTERLEPSAEWPAFEEYGNPEVISNARRSIDGVLNPYGFAGDDFSVFRDGDLFYLGLSTPLSAILREGDECIFKQSTAGAIAFKKTGLRIEGLDIRGLPSGYYTSLANGMCARLYRAMQSSKPSGWPQMDSPESGSFTLVTLSSDVHSSSNRGKVLHTDVDGKVRETNVGYDDEGEGYGLRFVYELPRQ